MHPRWWGFTRNCAHSSPISPPSAGAPLDNTIFRFCALWARGEQAAVRMPPDRAPRGIGERSGGEGRRTNTDSSHFLRYRALSRIPTEVGSRNSARQFGGDPRQIVAQRPGKCDANVPFSAPPPQTSNNQIEVVLFRTGLPSVSLNSIPISLI